MYKILAAAAVLSMTATSVSATVVDAFDLDVTSAAGTNSSIVLNAGQSYTLTVSGTFLIGNDRSRHVTDAEYFNLGSSPLTPIDGVGSDIGVGVDGMDIVFGPYNADNIYSTEIIGSGSTINVFFADSNYGDNVGSLAVELSTVPLPAGMALLLTGLGGLGIARRRNR